MLGESGVRLPEGLSRQSLPVYFTTHSTHFCRHRVCIHECAHDCSAHILERGSRKDAITVLRDIISALQDNGVWAKALTASVGRLQVPLGRARPGCRRWLRPLSLCWGTHGISQRWEQGSGIQYVSGQQTRRGGMVYLRARSRPLDRQQEPGKTGTQDRLRSEVWAAIRRHCGVVTTWSW